MAKEDIEDFQNSSKYWICDNDHVEGNFKVRDHCHVTKRYRGSARGDCNINAKLNYKIPIDSTT